MPRTLEVGVLDDPSNLKVLAKFGLCSNLLAKIRWVSHTRARKIFASTRMLRFSLKFLPCSVSISTSWKLKLAHCFPYGKLWNTWETCARHECVWKNASSYCWRLLKLTGLSSVPGSSVTLPKTFCLCWRLSLALLRGNLLACSQGFRKLQILFRVHPLTLVM